MYVIKRDGLKEDVKFDKIAARIQKLIEGPGQQLSLLVDGLKVAQQVVSGLYAGVTTVELDQLAESVAVAMAPQHPDYDRLASRIAASNLAKQTPSTFSAAMEKLFAYVHPATGATSILSDELMATVRANQQVLDAAIVPERDYEYSYFGLKTLQRAYLMKCGETEIVERPSYMLMRVSLGIHGDDVEAALETYDHMSRRVFTHATPTLFNAGTRRPQCSSCFLETVGDSITDIFAMLGKSAEISKHSGGIGLDISNIRPRGSYIRGSGGCASGIVPMMRVYNATARYVDQGGGKRPGR